MPSITVNFCKLSFVKYDSINKFHLFQVCCSMNFRQVYNCETTTVTIYNIYTILKSFLVSF